MDLYLFYYEGEEDGWTFEIEANNHCEAFNKAYKSYGPQVKEMMSKVIEKRNKKHKTMREIKFRIWDGKKMRYNVAVNQSVAFYIPTGIGEYHTISVAECEVMQYTGFKDKNEKSIYEGDILRDKDDDIYTAIYIKEWGMFATVTADEYKAYQAIGVSALDEELIWTFPIENGAFKIVSNIYENPKILE